MTRLALARWTSPVALAFAPGALAQLGRECAALGRRALLVTDGRLAEAAHGRAALGRLAEAGVAATVFTGVRANPDLATVRQAVRAAREAGAEVIVGFGGGSCLDVAKACAGAVRAPELLSARTWDGPSGVVEPALGSRPGPLSLIQVPTTHATGSEMGPIASLVDDRGDKRLLICTHLYARVALVDPELHRTVPRRQTAEGSLETLCRVLVPYLTDPCDRPLPDAHAEATARVLLDRTDAALMDPGDVAARGDLALAAASSAAGIGALGRSRFGHVLWYLSNALALHAGATKGQGLAPLLRAQLALLGAGGRAPHALGRPGRLARFGAAALDTARSAGAAARALLARVDAWGLPRGLAELGVGDDDIGPLVVEARRLWDGPPLAGLEDRDVAALYRLAL
jgi:alcohol dehydrogenase class IV